MVTLWIAPAASGKTEFIVRCAQERTQQLQETPRIVVPTALQAHACSRRLARRGALGVSVLTMNEVAQALLDEAGAAITPVPDPVQVRLLRSVIDEAPLDYYQALRTTPGFLDAVRSLCQELEAAGIDAAAFVQALQAMQAPPRLTEMAQIYTGYEARMAAKGWTDDKGVVNWALRALAASPGVARQWSCVWVDGFDQFAPAQVELLRLLATRVDDLGITLTGDLEGVRSPIVLRRFAETRRRLEKAFGIEGQPLPTLPEPAPAALAHLERHCFDARASALEAGESVVLVAATEEEAEVRAALRWLKARLLVDGMKPSEVALLTRDLSPYRHLIASVAAEYEMPVRIWGGLPLAENPAISDLLGLLKLVVPHPRDAEALAFHPLLDAWRSPYFAWPADAGGDSGSPGIHPADADALDLAGRMGRVVKGWPQWQETLTLLAEAPAAAGVEAEGDRPQPQPITPAAAAGLLSKLEWFVERLTPPQGLLPVRRFVRWVEEIIGQDSDVPRSAEDADPPKPGSLDMVARIREAQADPALVRRDIAALQALKDVLRGLVWAEEALALPPEDFQGFLADLMGAVEAATYAPAPPEGAETVLAADVTQARGLPLRAVAVLGLAEGVFPATRREDAFLQDADRQKLRQAYGLPLNDSLESAEASFFYETVTRSRERLLFTRPRLATGGAAWPESPYWQEIQRLLIFPARTPDEQGQEASQPGASWPEVMAALARSSDERLRQWLEDRAPQRLQEFERSTRVFGGRYRRSSTPHNGDLTHIAPVLARRFGRQHLWSASRLETYLNCPFRFFVSAVLGVQPRPEPALGMDSSQRGLLLHEMVRDAYHDTTNPDNPSEVLAKLDEIAGPLFDGAPKRLGFRPTAWWEQTCATLLDTVKRTIIALAGEDPQWRPRDYEASFGYGASPALDIPVDGADGFRLRGMIDRVDTNGQNEARVIDYKSGSASRYGERSLERGETIQVPLYALAVEQCIGRGRVIDGFYWSLPDAKAGTLRLRPDAEAAASVAVGHAWYAVNGVRSGQFAPEPPDNGCPDFCPALAFCWRYRAQ